MRSLLALVIGFGLDLIFGDPHWFPHPVIFIGKLIRVLECAFCKVLPKTALGEKLAGGFLWIVVVAVSTAVPALILKLCRINPYLHLAVESFMCCQILATKSLRDESLKVYKELKSGNIEGARKAVSMIVGRDTERLDEAGITRAAVETIAENTCDAIVAPLIFCAIGGAPVGFLYKSINTMDSMLGYTDERHKNRGLVPAKADDVANFIPARIAAILMLVSGWLLRYDVKNGFKIFRRDRFNHASPNSAQTESMCAGLLGIRLAGDAWYGGVLHKKKYIGDALRKIEHADIKRAARLSLITALLALITAVAVTAVVMRF